MRRNYHTLDNRGKVNERKLTEFLGQNRQQILPMVELITESRMAIDDLVNAMGRATIETVLQLSAEQVAGPPQQGRRRVEGIFWHGTQAGSVYLKERKLKVHKPRLRKKGGGVPGRGRGASLRGHAGSNRDGIADAGHPARRRIDAAI